ncbi:hypothetical protein D3C84_1275300 [compost metagenome]
MRSTAASAPAKIAANAPANANPAMIQNTIDRLRLSDCTCAMVWAWVDTNRFCAEKYSRSGSISPRLRAYRRNAG